LSVVWVSLTIGSSGLPSSFRGNFSIGQPLPAGNPRECKQVRCCSAGSCILLLYLLALSWYYAAPLSPLMLQCCSAGSCILLLFRCTPVPQTATALTPFTHPCSLIITLTSSRSHAPSRRHPRTHPHTLDRVSTTPFILSLIARLSSHS
jgi:hypothetical protein